MGSLFDLAAELSQYASVADSPETVNHSLPLPSIDTSRKTSGSKPAWADTTGGNLDAFSPPNTMTALSLLDETLLAIYETTQPPPTQKTHPRPALLLAQKSAPQLVLSTKPVDDSNHHPRQRRPTTPLQNVFSHSLSLATAPTTATTQLARPTPTPTQQLPVRRQVPPPPLLVSTPSSSSSSPSFSLTSTAAEAATAQSPVASSRGRTNQDDPDMSARAALREITEELGELPETATASQVQRQRLQRSLTDKYLHDRLNKLPNTPFVLLARKKTQQRIDQLTSTETEQPSKPESNKALPAQTAVPAASAVSVPTGFSLDQHEMLVKLARIPDTHVAKLSTTQHKMVQFAKRYDKILRLSTDDLQRLPVSQAQLLQQLRQQMPPSSVASTLS